LRCAPIIDNKSEEESKLPSKGYSNKNMLSRCWKPFITGAIHYDEPHRAGLDIARTV